MQSTNVLGTMRGPFGVAFESEGESSCVGHGDDVMGVVEMNVAPVFIASRRKQAQAKRSRFRLIDSKAILGSNNPSAAVIWSSTTVPSQGIEELFHGGGGELAWCGRK